MAFLGHDTSCYYCGLWKQSEFNNVTKSIKEISKNVWIWEDKIVRIDKWINGK